MFLGFNHMTKMDVLDLGILKGQLSDTLSE